jgi:hypothetical protein
MQEIPFTQILVLLAFILYPLLNWLLQRMQRRYQSQAPRQPPSQPAPRTFAKAPPAEIIIPAGPPAPPLRVSESLLSRRNQSRRSLFRSRRDLRRAVILMTVLGACRANDTPDDQG